MSNNRPPSQANRPATPAVVKPAEALDAAPVPQVTSVGATPAKADPPPKQTTPPRGPKYIWLVKPSFTMGDARAYFTKEDALKDFGRPLEDWTDHGHIAQIKFGPKWDPFECEWELEKIQVR